jgi:hypothetical protein
MSVPQKRSEIFDVQEDTVAVDTTIDSVEDQPVLNRSQGFAHARKAPAYYAKCKKNELTPISFSYSCAVSIEQVHKRSRTHLSDPPFHLPDACSPLSKSFA